MNAMEQANQLEFRFTIASKYPKGCPGYSDVSARNGHYVFGRNITEAVSKMLDRGLVKSPAEFDVQYWGNHPNRGQLI